MRDESEAQTCAAVMELEPGPPAKTHEPSRGGCPRRPDLWGMGSHRTGFIIPKKERRRSDGGQIEWDRQDRLAILGALVVPVEGPLWNVGLQTLEAK